MIDNMDELMESVNNNLMAKAMERVIHRLEFPIAQSMGAFTELSVLAKQSKIEHPVSLVVTADTKKNPKAALELLTLMMKALVSSGLVGQDRIREFYFTRKSSYEERMEVYIIALDD